MKCDNSAKIRFLEEKIQFLERFGGVFGQICGSPQFEMSGDYGIWYDLLRMHDIFENQTEEYIFPVLKIRKIRKF